MAAVGQGFCHDTVPADPKIAFIFDMPTGDDIREQKGLSGGTGRYWSKMLITDLGYRRQDVLLSSCLRCGQRKDRFGQPEYPKEPLRRQAEMNCRQYDGNLIRFDPDCFVVTLSPRSFRAIGCNTRMVTRDVHKAMGLAAQGHRPAVLFGEGAVELYYPWLRGAGGLKNWRGHYWFGESPFKEGVPRKRIYGN